MEPTLILIALLLVVGAVAGPVLGSMALARVRRAEERFEARLERLQRELDAQSASPTRVVQTTTPAARPASASAAAARIVQSPEPKREQPHLPRQLDLEPPPPPPIEVPVEVPIAKPVAKPVTTPGPTAPTRRAPTPQPVSIDWERWIGIRGAALLGGVALALAGVFFAQIAIDRNWFGPAARVTSGGLLGLALLVLRAPIARVTTDLVADVLAGAGAVSGYASAWAAWKLHDLIPLEVAFPWMAAITFLACLQSVRHQRQVVALFGLIGGFATPLLLDTWNGNPFGLFGYLLLLDVGVLALARQGRWPWLAPLALGGTALLQGLWYLLVMGSEHATLGLTTAFGFGLLFALAAASLPGEDESAARARTVTRRTGLGIAALFAFTFASRAELDIGVVPLGALLLLSSAVACEMARRYAEPLLATAAAVVSLTVLTVWLGASGLTDTSLGGYAVAAIALAALFLGDARRGGRPVDGDWLTRPDAALTLITFAAVGVLSMTTHAAVPDVGIEALAAGGVVLLGLLVFGVGREWPGLPAGLALVLGLGLGPVARSMDSAYAIGVAQGVAAGVALLGWIGARQRPWFGAIAPALLIPIMLLAPGPISDEHGFGAAGLCVLAGLAAAGARSTGSLLIYVAVVLAAGIGASQLAWSGEGNPRLLWVLAPLVTVLAPLAPLAPLTRRPSKDELWVAAGAPLLWFNLAVMELAKGTVGVPALLLMLACAPAALALLARRDQADAPIAAPLASALTLVAFALAYALAAEWFAVGLVLAGLAAITVGRRHGVLLLARIGSCAQVLGTFALLVLAVIPGRFPSSSFPPGGAICVAYGLTALALAGGALLQRDDERRALARNTLGCSAALLVFAWICLSITDAFHGGERIVFELVRHEARDLTLSIAWALYALALLGLGTWARRPGLRWLSLAFTLLTVGKVFLIDLGELEGLYRVASMAGLAISLLLVSLLYQRVVFRGPAALSKPGEPGEPGLEGDS